VQAYLPRSHADAKRLIALGGRVRLVKGAYSEPRRIAYRSRVQVNRAFVTLMELLLTQGLNPAIATHDPSLLDATRQFARARGIPAGAYEFQMLYGVRRDLQQALAAEGYRIRVFVPFGSEWFPYLMGRLGDRPSDLRFILRDVLTQR
jgi:proline dehydrogenase